MPAEDPSAVQVVGRSELHHRGESVWGTARERLPLNDRLTVRHDAPPGRRCARCSTPRSRWGIGTEISDGPLAVHRLPLPQPAPLCTSRVIGAVGSMTMMSSSDMSVFAVGWTMCAGT